MTFDGTVKPPFDRVEVTIRGYKDKRVLSVANCWTLQELAQMSPYAVSNYVACKVMDMTQALTNEALKEVNN